MGTVPSFALALAQQATEQLIANLGFSAYFLMNRPKNRKPAAPVCECRTLTRRCHPCDLRATRCAHAVSSMLRSASSLRQAPQYQKHRNDKHCEVADVATSGRGCDSVEALHRTAEHAAGVVEVFVKIVQHAVVSLDVNGDLARNVLERRYFSRKRTDLQVVVVLVTSNFLGPIRFRY